MCPQLNTAVITGGALGGPRGQKHGQGTKRRYEPFSELAVKQKGLNPHCPKKNSQDWPLGSMLSPYPVHATVAGRRAEIQPVRAACTRFLVQSGGVQKKGESRR